MAYKIYWSHHGHYHAGEFASANEALEWGKENNRGKEFHIYRVHASGKKTELVGYYKTFGGYTVYETQGAEALNRLYGGLK